MIDPPIVLREITAETVRRICDLVTSEAQRMFVAPNAVSIAQAYFDRSAEFRAIHAGEEPVGFVMWRPTPDGAACYVWRLMIDHRHQAKGYGRAALAELASVMAERGVGRMRLSCVPDPSGPTAFYERLGFTDTGERLPNGEHLLARNLD